MSLSLVKNLGKEKEEGFESKKDNGNKQIFTNGKCYPPPISCLRKVKVGKPFRYVAYDKENDSYVVEKINIPNGCFKGGWQVEVIYELPSR